MSTVSTSSCLVILIKIKNLFLKTKLESQKLLHKNDIHLLCKIPNIIQIYLMVQ